MPTLWHRSSAGTLCLPLRRLDGVRVNGLAVGAVLAGRYTIARVLARGGMSCIYTATDALLNGRQVAIKELRPAPEATEEERREAEAWFARESYLLSTLHHPLIPAFYSAFHEGEHSYIVREFILGESLETLVTRLGPLHEPRVLEWGIALCALLVHLHGLAEPVILRDMKPANILLRDDTQQLMLVDFGIARVYQAGVVGTVVGTPGYAPPEQYQGLATPQSDVYALGVTLHRLLTGYDPEQGALFSFPHVRKLNPAVSTTVGAAIFRATRLDPAGRPASAHDLAALLQGHSPLDALDEDLHVVPSHPVSQPSPAAAPVPQPTPIAPSALGVRTPLPASSGFRISPWAWGVAAAPFVILLVFLVLIETVPRHGNAARCGNPTMALLAERNHQPIQGGDTNWSPDDQLQPGDVVTQVLGDGPAGVADVAVGDRIVSVERKDVYATSQDRYGNTQTFMTEVDWTVQVLRSGQSETLHPYLSCS